MSVNIYNPLPGDGLDAEEAALYRLINEYRVQNGLSPVELSPSLTLVANRHVWDLQENVGYLTHDWSDATGPEAYWYAPDRLDTHYSDYAFENAYWTSAGQVNVETALQGWKNSSSHNAVLLNLGPWEDMEWNAIGIGIHQGYAVMWVGEESDPAPDVFAEQYYLSNNPDIAAAVESGAFGSGREHFLEFGAREGRQPSFLFNPRDYLTQHADLQDAGMDEVDAVHHFQVYGMFEGRAVSDLFDVAYYLDQNADLQEAGMDYAEAYQHFYNHGIYEGRASSAEFDVAYYLEENADLQNAGFGYEEAFVHFESHGAAEGRRGR